MLLCSLLKGESYPSPKFLFNSVPKRPRLILADKGDFNSKISSEKAYNIDYINSVNPQMETSFSCNNNTLPNKLLNLKFSNAKKVDFNYENTHSDK